MLWVKLVNSYTDCLPHGTVLRLLGKYPYEDIVDFMVFDPLRDDKGQALIVSSGYKAGLLLVVLPVESLGDGHRTIDRDWLIKNWAHWVYPECDVNDVYICDAYEAVPVGHLNSITDS